MCARHAVREDQRAVTGGEDDVDGPGGEVLGDDGAQPLGERRFRGDQGLLDVLAGVMAGGEEHVIVGVVGPGPLEDLEVNLLADLGLHRGRDLAWERSSSAVSSAGHYRTAPGGGRARASC